MKLNLCVFAVVLTSTAFAQEPAPPRLDVAKGRVVERPTEELVGDLSSSADQTRADPAAKAADRTKRVVIEPAVERLVGDTQPPDAAPANEPQAAAASDNPPVEPGKVKWHGDVTAAIAAAKKSGKPVLVFHLLGQLDQRFT
jgi:hypothetical protein